MNRHYLLLPLFFWGIANTSSYAQVLSPGKIQTLYFQVEYRQQQRRIAAVAAERGLPLRGKTEDGNILWLHHIPLV
ncbi:hypothetical protein [Eisenibacter elegans]|uniref:hypothetical protein n=1 Tax=Eisenibacter elegans TaxID=997 RepID=UPI00040ED13D|nr:hypothetical protein [Eisenibacter elegans]